MALLWHTCAPQKSPQYLCRNTMLLQTLNRGEEARVSAASTTHACCGAAFAERTKGQLSLPILGRANSVVWAEHSSRSIELHECWRMGPEMGRPLYKVQSVPLSACTITKQACPGCYIFVTRAPALQCRGQIQNPNASRCRKGVTPRSVYYFCTRSKCPCCATTPILGIPAVQEGADANMQNAARQKWRAGTPLSLLGKGTVETPMLHFPCCQPFFITSVLEFLHNASFSGFN